VAAGIRRIEAVTGTGVLKLLDEQKALLEEAASALKLGNVKELPKKAASAAAQIRSLENEISRMKEKENAGAAKDIGRNAEEINGLTLYAAKVGEMDADGLRSMASSLRDGKDGAVALLISSDGTKATLCAASSPAAIAKGAKAGRLVKAAAGAMGGNGGGRDDMAMAGGKQPEKADEAIQAVRGLLASL
jgi:alanyl-tRNA synthetase